jgi:two-component system chemotaxis sensor kinase CheA
MRRLEDLMRQVADLSVQHWRLNGLLPELEGAPPPVRQELRRGLQAIERGLRDLRHSILNARLVPLSEAFGPMPLAVRDLSRAMQKDVRVVMQGEDTEIDKDVVERLLDPLLHLVRNAVAHGIEPPARRIEQGKSPTGTVTLRGASEGDTIVITVEDDGAGISLPALASQAVQLGWLPAGYAINTEEALSILCRPGFSTHGQTDLSAGRGVGMDVVRRAVQSMGGSLSLRTEPGRGTAFIVRLPLTLLLTRVVLVQAGLETYALPADRVDEVFEIEPGRVTRVEGGEMYPLRDTSVALLRLADLFHLPPGAPGTRPGGYGLALRGGDRRAALVADRLLGMRDVVVRTLSDPLLTQPGVAGAIQLGDGSAALILDPQEWIHSA